MGLGFKANKGKRMFSVTNVGARYIVPLPIRHIAMDKPKCHVAPIERLSF